MQKFQELFPIVNLSNKLPVKIGVVLSIYFFSQISYSKEGDTFESYGVCHIELADGSLEKIDCKRGRGINNDGMNNEDKARAVAVLAAFDKSLLADEAKLASWEVNAKSKKEIIDKYPLEVFKKAKKLKDGKYLVKIIFINEWIYPLKDSTTHRYRVYDNGMKLLDDAQGAKWDDVIANQVIGSNYADYQTSIDVVTRDNVIVTVTLDEASILSTLIADKKVRSVDHAGMPEIVYEEITPVHIKN